jgi:hypothetical protein
MATARTARALIVFAGEDLRETGDANGMNMRMEFSSPVRYRVLD